MKNTIALLALLALAVPVRADLIRINFDDQPAGWPGWDYPGLGINLFSADTYPTRQVGAPLESNTAYQIVASPLAISPPNIAQPEYLDRINQSGAYSDLGGSFRDWLTGRSASTDYVQFWVVSPLSVLTDKADGWEVQFFGPDYNTVVDTVTPSIGGDTFVSLYRPGGIGMFVLFSPTHQEGIDDLAFDAPVVPEPGTLLLLVTAAGMLAWHARKECQRWRTLIRRC
jgi:hypothetical protein